ncbi:MAG: sensor domain-containing protein [Pseudomonadota bacterium]|nr:sensor domain-containing protein [Pseudomonadota bacterium]
MKTIPDYLAQLRAALAGADPALMQDALYDAEEYLRSELAEHPEMSEADVIAAVAGSYGAPGEVAAIYLDTEVKVQTALRAPPPRERSSALGRFFGVAADPRTYGAIFYSILALATGIFYFTWVVTGISISLGLSVIIIGIPFVILFLGSVRLLSLVEGRIVEVMLGERMPRRPLYADRDRPVLTRIAEMFTDPRTWSTLLYMLLMLPLGILYFLIAVATLSIALSLVLAPPLLLFGAFDGWSMSGGWIGYWEPASMLGLWELPLVFACGVVLLFASMHLLRGIGQVHGAIAKQLLVKA